MSCHLRTLATSIPQVLTKMRTTTIFAENNVYGNINNSTKEVKSFFHDAVTFDEDRDFHLRTAIFFTFTSSASMINFICIKNLLSLYLGRYQGPITQRAVSL